MIVAVISTYGRETSSPRTCISTAFLEIGTAIINPLRYWLLTPPATRSSLPVQPELSINTGGQPAGDSQRIDPSQTRAIASVKSPIGRSCIRGTPDRRYRPPYADRAAVR